METIIKNIHLIKDLTTEENIKKLEIGALQHRKFARITFKVISVIGKVMQIHTVQTKSPHENHADEDRLILRTKELFLHFFPDYEIQVTATPYQANPTEKVTPEYIREAMNSYDIKVKDIVDETGIDKSNVSAWVNGTRSMSQPVRAMFYYYIWQKAAVARTA
ncbi:hypothetical protein SAMN04487996_110239 [Dyadobacter soli]|uniref:Helix-turn-helix n=1 Tax=Dyadobacter soli TaxID=659014 RepID=A0A1G7KW14_9BACT|nr:hypothetical protein [Dyadobacter soli]SDF41448.1 hypothetical protein SAMN04487996_110239 [Dyadobacter soli]